MSIKKTQYWFSIDTSYRILTYNLASQPSIHIVRTKTGNTASRGKFTFEVTGQYLEGVRFQLTANDKLGIYAPIGVDIDEIIQLIKPIFDKTVGKPVILTQYYSSELKRDPVVEEANYQALSRIIEKINNTNNAKLLFSKFTQLRTLTSKKITHHPEVLNCLETCLDNPLVIENIETFRLLIEILRYIIHFEEKQKQSNSEAIQKIKNEISMKLISILENRPPDHYLLYSLPLLSLSGREEAVHLIFKKINSNPSKSMETVVDSFFYEYARALTNLYAEHSFLVDDFLDSLIEAEGEKAAAGLSLRQRILNETT